MNCNALLGQLFFGRCVSVFFFNTNLRICLFVFCVKLDLQVLFLGIKSPYFRCKPVRLGWGHILKLARLPAKG